MLCQRPCHVLAHDGRRVRAPRAQRLDDLRRGRGIAQRLLAATAATARRQGLSSLRLVSLAGAVRFWQRHGFQDVTPTPRLQTKLAGYGAGARLMQRRILAEPSPSA